MTRSCVAVLVILVAACSGGGKASEWTGSEAARFEVRAIERTSRNYPRPAAGQVAVRGQGQWLLLGPDVVNGYDVKQVNAVLGIEHHDEYTIQLSLVGTAAGRAIAASRSHSGLAVLVERRLVHVLPTPVVFGYSIVLGDTDLALMYVDLFTPRAITMAIAEQIQSGQPQVIANSPDASSRRASAICQGFLPRPSGFHYFGGFTAGLLDRDAAIRTTRALHADATVWYGVAEPTEVGDCSYYFGRGTAPNVTRHLMRYLVVTNGPVVRLSTPSCPTTGC